MPTPADRRHFLDWARPLLPQAVDYLAGKWVGKGPLDLSQTVVVVPTRQAGRRLREALAAYAAERGQGVFAPRVLTPDALLTADIGPGVATRLDSLLAWIAVLESVSLDEVRAVFPVDPPTKNFTWALRVAREFTALQQALAENGLRMVDVPEKFGSGFPEAERWAQLARLEKETEARLAAAGLRDGPRARIERAREPFLDGVARVVLLAAPDPLSLAIQALANHAATTEIAVVIFAPDTERAAFDEWGRPRVEEWRSRQIELPDFTRGVHLVADPVAEAEKMAEWAAGYAVPEGLIAFGVADGEVLPPLEGALLRRKIPTFNPEGRPRRHDGLFPLLSGLGALVGSATFGAVQAVARCPDLLAYLAAELGAEFSVARWLAELDQLHARHLPADLSSALAYARGDRECALAAQGLQQLEGLHRLLITRDFAAGVTAVLGAIYQHRELNSLRAEDAEFEAALGAWMELVRGAAETRIKGVKLSPAEWWEFALGLYGETLRADDKPEGALELQGWLELAWENAPHLVVAGLNDGRVPDVVAGDPFLPESLRARLGLRTNAVRLARDCYLLQALVSSRATAGRLDLLLAKTSQSGEPMRPSRLLLHCRDEELPARVRYLFQAVEQVSPTVAWKRAWPLVPLRVPPPERVAVTGLRSWLNCPFRFYLGQVLRMRPVDAAKSELDALDFGTLCHGALEGLASPAMRDCRDEGTLRNFLQSEIERLFTARYGAELSLPLLIQLEAARQRLGKAAEVQARERGEGWVIVEVERKFELEFAGLVVSGRIDRIERHETTGQIRVVDYKTSDTAVAPRDVHLRSIRRDESPPAWAQVQLDDRQRVWADLQLPLYRQALVAEFGGDTVCGYFNLPKAAADTGLVLWPDFSPELQLAAMACAREACAAIKAGVFWPPNESLDPEVDAFATLFQHGVVDSVAWEVNQ